MHLYPLFCKKVGTGADLVLYVWSVYHKKRFAIEHGPGGLNCNCSAWDVEDFGFEFRPGRWKVSGLNRGRGILSDVFCSFTQCIVK
jgi:hypothetical protein